MARLPANINRLITELARLPGIGSKTAQRLAFYILGEPEEKALALAEAIRDARTSTLLCSRCCNLTEEDPCEICSDESRDNTVVCVVESPADVSVMERTRFSGRYHVLHGAINPMQGVGPNDIKLRELFQRLGEEDSIQEVILATNATAEGEATATYIARMLKPAGIRTTRLAHGIPMGTNLEYADEMTLGKALDGRQDI